jgi:hypothetical protein
VHSSAFRSDTLRDHWHNYISHVLQVKAAETSVINTQLESLKKERVAQAEARCVFLYLIAFLVSSV